MNDCFIPVTSCLLLIILVYLLIYLFRITHKCCVTSEVETHETHQEIEQELSDSVPADCSAAVVVHYLLIKSKTLKSISFSCQHNACDHHRVMCCQDLFLFIGLIPSLVLHVVATPWTVFTDLPPSERSLSMTVNICYLLVLLLVMIVSLVHYISFCLVKGCSRFDHHYEHQTCKSVVNKLYALGGVLLVAFSGWAMSASLNHPLSGQVTSQLVVGEALALLVAVNIFLTLLWRAVFPLDL